MRNHLLQWQIRTSASALVTLFFPREHPGSYMLKEITEKSHPGWNRALESLQPAFSRGQEHPQEGENGGQTTLLDITTVCGPLKLKFSYLSIPSHLEEL